MATFKIEKRFAFAIELRRGHYEKFEQGYALGLVYDGTPPPLPRFKRSAASAD